MHIICASLIQLTMLPFFLSYELTVSVDRGDVQWGTIMKAQDGTYNQKILLFRIKIK